VSPVEDHPDLDRRQPSAVQLDGSGQISLSELVAAQLDALGFEPVGNRVPADAELLCQVVGRGTGLVALDELGQLDSVQPLGTQAASRDDCLLEARPLRRTDADTADAIRSSSSVARDDEVLTRLDRPKNGAAVATQLALTDFLRRPFRV
jgi:hypothetical protein